MDLNGLSDPYIVFTGPYLADDKRTTIIEATLTPIYKDTDVPSMQPFITNREYLEAQVRWPTWNRRNGKRGSKTYPLSLSVLSLLMEWKRLVERFIVSSVRCLAPSYPA
jgi:hypothetical protein